MSATAALHRAAAPDLDRLTAAGMTFDRRTSPVHANSAESILIRKPTRRWWSHLMRLDLTCYFAHAHHYRFTPLSPFAGSSSAPAWWIPIPRGPDRSGHGWRVPVCVTACAAAAVDKGVLTSLPPHPQ